MGLVLIEVVVMVDAQVVLEAVGLETTYVGLSLATEERPEAGREGDEAEKVLEKLGELLDFSVRHVGPGLEGV